MSSLKEILQNPTTTVIDVRNDWEFESGHYTGAVNIPLDQLPQRMQELESAEGAIVLYCRSGNRSGMALNFLKQQGFEDLYNGGGIDDMLQIAR
jgi:phage shock protein E